MVLHVGELVERYSHNRDILFRIIEIKGEIAILFGEEIRLVADAPLEDLISIDQREHKKRAKREKETMERTYRLFQQDYVLMKQRHEHTSTGGYTSEVNYFQMPGRVLHIDGDPLYLRKCLDLYNKIGVPVQGIHCKETEMHEKVVDLIDHFRPDILVITGHDAYTKSKGVKGDLAAYRHSRHFVQAVREVRKNIHHWINSLFLLGHVNRTLKH